MWTDPTDFSLEPDDREVTIRVSCAIDARRGAALERMAAGLLGGAPPAIAVDLRDCPSVDSSGVRSLIRLWRRAEERAVPFRLSHCSHAVERVLRAMHLDGILHLPPSRERQAPPCQLPSRFHRFILREPIHVWNGLLHRVGETRGWSTEGLVLEIPGPLRLFEVLRMEVTTPDTGERFRFMGRVVRRHPEQSGLADVEFLSLDPAMRLWLQKHTPGLAAPPPPPPRPSS